MIYLFYGTDTNKVRAKAFAWVEAARAKQSEAPYFRISADAITAESLAEAAGASGLFFKKSLVLIDDPFSLKESGEILLESLDFLAKSENPIAILAPKMLAANTKKLESKAEKLFKHDKAAKPERGFNTALVNALAVRDGKTLWKEIVKALRAGDAAEQVHGLLHWKARDLMQKSRASAEARRLSVELIELLAETREESRDLGRELERWALGI